MEKTAMSVGGITSDRRGGHIGYPALAVTFRSRAATRYRVFLLAVGIFLASEFFLDLPDILFRCFSVV